MTTNVSLSLASGLVLISQQIHKQWRPANFFILDQIAKIIQVVVAELIVKIVYVFKHRKKK